MLDTQRSAALAGRSADLCSKLLEGAGRQLAA
jgi:hypothetical protein